MPASSPSNSQRAIAIALGLLPAAIGTSALLRPVEQLQQMNLATPTAPSDQRTAHALLYVYAIRTVFLGSVLGLGAMLGDRTVLGGLLLLAAGVAAADTLVVYSMDIGGHVPSGIVTAVIASVGTWVLSSR